MLLEWPEWVRQTKIFSGTLWQATIVIVWGHLDIEFQFYQ